MIGVGVGVSQPTGAAAPPDPYGPELLVNGDMSSDVGWDLQGSGGPVPTIAGGKLTMDDGDELGPTAGQAPTTDVATYHLVYTIDSITAGTVDPLVGGAGVGTSRSAPGTYTQDILADGTDSFFFTKNGGGVAVIDNASLKQVL